MKKKVFPDDMKVGGTELLLHHALWSSMSPGDVSLPLELDAPPSIMWLAFTSQCNLMCKHCIRYRNKLEHIDQSRVELSEAVFARLEEEVFGGLDACIVGGNNHGEQLLSKWWDRFVGDMRGRDCLVEIISNCTVLSKEKALQVVENDFQLRCSIEGATARTYELIRGFSFEKLMANLDYLSKCLKDHPRSKTGVVFNFTMFESNARELIPLIELCARLGFKGISVLQLFPRNQFQRYQSMVFNRSLYAEMYDKGTKLAEKEGIVLHMQPPFPMGSIVQSEEEAAHPVTPSKTLYCPLPWKAVSVDSDGKVYPCCSSRMEMGDLTRQSMMEIWNGARYRKLRKGILTMRLPNVCRDCQWMRWGKETRMREADVLGSIGGVGELSPREAAKMMALSIVSKAPLSKKLRRLLRYIYLHS